MALPKFYLEPRPSEKQAINMFYSFYGQRLQYYTGIRIDPKFYKDHKMVKNKETGIIDRISLKIDRSDVSKLISDNAPYAEVIKSNLKQIALDVQNIANTAKANKIEVTVSLLRDELDKIHKHKPEESSSTPDYDFVSYFEKLISDSVNGKRVIPKGKSAGKRYTANSIKNYKSTLSAIMRYKVSNKIKSISFADINKVFYEKFKEFCYGPGEEKEISTFAGFIKDIKTVMTEAKEAGLQNLDGHKSNGFILPSYESDTIYLTQEQIEAIGNLDLSDYSRFVTHEIPHRDRSGRMRISEAGKKLTKTEKISYRVLDKARDMFLIGVYTGLRFGNFSKLDLKSVEAKFIKLKQVKTGTRISIPIMEKLRPVLAKYADELPTLSNQKFNTYIKLVAELAGLKEPTEVKSYRGNIETVTIEPLFKLVSSHCCRRSYATNMFKMGVPTMLIMNSTGHKTEGSFLKYIRATNEDKAIMMAAAMEKLGL
jgi:site-specific recombinase XerD